MSVRESVVVVAAVVGACGVNESHEMATSALRCERPAMTSGTDPIVFESAVVEPGPYDTLPARLIDGDHFVGVQFTTTRTYAVTGLGAHIYTAWPSCGDCTPPAVSMAVLPLDASTNLPKTNTLRDAICWTVGTIPYAQPVQQPEPFASTVFPADFVLPSGSWGLVVASNRFDARFVEGLLPLDVTPVGAPSYFHYVEGEGVGEGPETGQWMHTASPDHIRLFVVGH